MRAQELDSKPAGFYAWAAARDAAVRSYAASTKYTQAQKILAERIKLGLEMVYAAAAIHVNFREKFIAIKVDQPCVRDRINLNLLEKDYQAQGITKAESAQGIIYRIPRV